ncbi:putative CD5 antigen-like [Sesbania bispinosa]|nr:putative CD5 antigen-like [Sesbania bispinosa]
MKEKRVVCDQAHNYNKNTHNKGLLLQRGTRTRRAATMISNNESSNDNQE